MMGRLAGLNQLQKILTIICDTEALRMANKRKCPHCKKYNKPEDAIKVNISYFCNIEHATKHGYKNKEQGRKIKHREQKKELKSNDRPFREKQAQAAFNAYIRERDYSLPCVSCGRNHNGQYHAGHYRSRGAHPELRFEELNCHKQCAPCNNHLSGNISNYRPALIKKIGLDKLDWIEGPHEIVKYTCEELKEIELLYKQKLKELQTKR